MERITRVVWEVDPREVWELPPQVYSRSSRQRAWPELSEAVSLHIARQPILEIALTPWSFMQRCMAHVGAQHFEQKVRLELGRWSALSSTMRLLFERCLRAWRALLLEPGSRQVILKAREVFEVLHHIEADVRQWADLQPPIWQRYMRQERLYQPHVVLTPPPTFGVLGFVREGIIRSVRARAAWDLDQIRLMGFSALRLEHCDLEMVKPVAHEQVLPFWLGQGRSEADEVVCDLGSLVWRLPPSLALEQALSRIGAPDSRGQLDPELAAQDWLGVWLQEAGDWRMAWALHPQISTVRILQSGTWSFRLASGNMWTLRPDAASEEGCQLYPSDMLALYTDWTQRTP